MRAIKAAHLSYADADESLAIYQQVLQFFHYENETHTWIGCPWISIQVKRRLYLLAPDEVDEPGMLELLESCPAEWGVAAQGKLIEVGPFSSSGVLGNGAAEVFEAMEHFEKAIVAANVDIGRYTINPVVLAQTQTTAGRCLAKLSRTDDAAAAFEAAIEVAVRSQMPFFEMLAHRDYIVHVLDAQGKRDSQLAALGGCIACMKVEPSAYTPILGAGIDAEAAVAQFRATAAE